MGGGGAPVSLPPIGAPSPGSGAPSPAARLQLEPGVGEVVAGEGDVVASPEALGAVELEALPGPGGESRTVAVDSGALRLELRRGGAPGVAGLLVCECGGVREVVWLQEVPSASTSTPSGEVTAEGRPWQPLEEWAQVRYVAGAYRVRVTAAEAVRGGLVHPGGGGKPAAAVASGGDPGPGLRVTVQVDRLRAHDVLPGGRQALGHLDVLSEGSARVWLSTVRGDTLGLQVGAHEDDALDVRLAVSAVKSSGSDEAHAWSVSVDAMRVDPLGTCEGHACVAATAGARFTAGDYTVEVVRVVGQTLRQRAEGGSHPLAPDGGAVYESEYALPLVHVLLGLRRVEPPDPDDDPWAALV